MKRLMKKLLIDAFDILHIIWWFSWRMAVTLAGILAVMWLGSLVGGP